MRSSDKRALSRTSCGSWAAKKPKFGDAITLPARDGPLILGLKYSWPRQPRMQLDSPEAAHQTILSLGNGIAEQPMEYLSAKAILDIAAKMIGRSSLLASKH